jgi:hypothetical protein
MKSGFAHPDALDAAANLGASLTARSGQHGHRRGGTWHVTPGMNGSAGMPSIRAVTLPAVSILGPPDQLRLASGGRAAAVSC